jgi:hypothetical protein
MSKRATVGLAVTVVVLALTACNPLPNQPTAVRTGDVSRSGLIVYTGERGWLEVQVRTAPTADVTVRIEHAEDHTRDPGTPAPDNWCHFATAPTPAMSGGSSLGFRRLSSIGPGTLISLEFDVPVEGTQFDVRVVDDAGLPIGDLVHHVPHPGKFESVWGSICAPR